MDAGQHDVAARIRAALGSGRLTAWQRSFLTDMLAKHERYGSRTRLSVKQHAALRKLIGDVLPEPVKLCSFEPSLPRPPYRPRRSNPVAREARWMGRRFIRDFAFALAFFAVIGIFAIVEPLSQQLGQSLGDWAAGSPSYVATRSLDRPQISVIDGDTIRVAGQAQSVRLVGFNAPETGRAQCSQEQALGHQAMARLQQLVATGRSTVEIVPCACKPGTHGTEACNFGRACGVLKVDGRDVGETLIAERLAVRFRCGPTGCPPLPRPWCI